MKGADDKRKGGFLMLPVTKIMSATGLSNKTAIWALQELHSKQLLECTGTFPAAYRRTVGRHRVGHDNGK